MVSKIRMSAGLQRFRSRVPFPGPDHRLKLTKKMTDHVNMVGPFLVRGRN